MSILIQNRKDLNMDGDWQVSLYDEWLFFAWDASWLVTTNAVQHVKSARMSRPEYSLHKVKSNEN